MILIEPPRHASEGGHWYDRDGNPVELVVGVKGQPVKPNIRHARKLGLLPGATSIGNCAHKPQLERWKIEQGMLAAYTLPPIPGESDKAWLSRVFEDSEKQGKAAADRGTLIHAAIQAHYQGKAPDPEFWPYVKMVVEVVRQKCGDQRWVAEKAFGHEHGYGGKADLHCMGWVIDFKSKDAKDLDDPAKKLVYDEHPQQLGAYRRGLEVPFARCANVFISRDEPIIVRFCEHEAEDLRRGLRMFDHLLKFWQEKNRYDSSFVRSREAA